MKRTVSNLARSALLTIYLITLGFQVVSVSASSNNDASSDAVIVFTPINVYPTDSTPAPAEGTLVWTGSFTNQMCGGIGCSSDTHTAGAQIAIANDCDGTDCWKQDLYYQIEIHIHWGSNFEHDIPTLQFARGPELVNGETANDVTQKCSVVADGTPPIYGDCDLVYKGMLTGSEMISPDTAAFQEWFLFNFGFTSGARMLTAEWTLTLSQQPITNAGNCSSQWTPGTKFATFTLSATNSTGVDLTQYNNYGRSVWTNTGAFVRVKVASGHWNNNGTGPDRTSLALKMPSAGDGTERSWHPLSTDQYTGCHMGELDYYFQISNPWSTYIRVNDQDENFSSNTGTLTIELYTSTYSPLQSDCDAKYKIGSQIETETIESGNATGILMGTGISSEPVNPEGGDSQSIGTRYFALETNIGPHWDGTGFWYSSEINTGSGWTREIQLPAVTCIIPLDNMGRVRIYFPAADNFKTWLFRAYDADGDRSNNNGPAGYTLYYAQLLQIYTPGNPSMDCSGTYSYSHSGTGGTAYTIESKNPNATQITNLLGGHIYAIETSGGPWANNGAPTFGVAISSDQITWDTLYDFPFALCAQATDGNHYVVYFEPLAGTNYYLRVDDPAQTWADNNGSIVATVYPATLERKAWSVCTDDYIINPIDIPVADRTILANKVQGLGLSRVESGKMYALEITDLASWKTAAVSTSRWDAEISDDGGTSWQEYQSADFLSCVVKIGDEPRYRIVFTADGDYRIRVHHDTGVFDSGYVNNIGSLIYTLSEVKVSDVTSTTSQPGYYTGTIPYTPGSWAETCSGVVNTPSSIFIFQTITFTVPGIGTIPMPLPVPNIGDWSTYAVAAINSYLSWCPQHTAALAGIWKMYSNYEPFGTVDELNAASTSLQQKISAATSSGGEFAANYTPYSVIFNASGGDGSDQNAWSILPVLGNNSPWSGGTIGSGDLGDTSGDAVGGESDMAYWGYCSSVFQTYIGAKTASAMCQLITIAKTIPWVWTAMQLLLDAGALIALGQYVMVKWINLGAAG
jgi:hypothetical protein